MNPTKLHKLCASALLGAGLIVAVAQSHAYEFKLGELPPLAVHGFASQGYLSSSDYNYLGNTTEGTFQFTELGLNAAINPFPRTRIAVQAFAFDLGDVGNLKPFLDYASIEYTFNDVIGVRAGRVRRSSGLYNHIQDVDLSRTFILLPQGLYDARWRDWSTSLDGVDIFGSFTLGKAGSLSYELIGGRLTPTQDGGLAKSLQNRLAAQGGKFLKVDPADAIGTQLWWQAPIDGLRVGAYVGKVLGFKTHNVIPLSPVGPIYLDTEGDVTVQQYSLEYRIKDWTFQGEYLTYKNDGTSTTTNAFLGKQTVSNATVIDAGYVSAAYRFTEWLEVGSYYTEYYPDTEHRSGSADAYQKDLALALRFDVKDWWIVKIEGHQIKGTALLADDVHNPVRKEGGWTMLAVKTTLSF